MAKLNIFKRVKKARTHEGAPARTFGPEAAAAPFGDELHALGG